MISVIVPVYNCEAYLDESIQSLMQQTYFEHMEIIFIDDGSKDNSTKIISKYTEKHSNMRLIKQTNHGVSAARNRGIEAASGEYIAFFDADDIAEKLGTINYEVTCMLKSRLPRVYIKNKHIINVKNHI